MTIGARTNEELQAIWSKLRPANEVYKQLAQRDPVVLIDWLLRGKLCPGQRTWAAGALAQARPSAIVVPALFLLFLGQPDSPLVHEGAMDGLAGHLDYPGVRDCLQGILHRSPFLELRKYAAELLDETPKECSKYLA